MKLHIYYVIVCMIYMMICAVKNSSQYVLTYGKLCTFSSQHICSLRFRQRNGHKCSFELCNFDIVTNYQTDSWESGGYFGSVYIYTYSGLYIVYSKM